MTTESPKRIYIAGAIAGEPHPERKFQAAAGILERLGYIPVNPFTVAPTTDGWSYEQYLIADLHAMLDCDEVVALPCWKRSKGATIEVQLALRLNKPVRFIERLSTIGISSAPPSQ